MAERMIRTTGVLKGLHIPESCRGQFVLIVNGKIIAASRDAAEIMSKARQVGGRPFMLDVPETDDAIAAY